MLPLKFQLGLWLFAITGFAFGIPERVISLSSDHWLDSQDLTQLFTAITFAATIVGLNPLWRE